MGTSSAIVSRYKNSNENARKSLPFILEAKSQDYEQLGIEWEINVTNQEDGALCDGYPIAEKMGQQGEYSIYNIEFGTEPAEWGSDTFGGIAGQLKHHTTCLTEDHGCYDYSSGMNSLLRWDIILSPGFLNPSKIRYTELISEWRRDNGGKINFRLPGVRSREINSPDPIGVLTSCQYHLGVRKEDIPHALNISYLLNSVCLAPFVSGGRWLGEDSYVEDLRYFVWRSLFPGRTGVSLGEDWVSDLRSHLETLLDHPTYQITLEGEEGFKGDLQSLTAHTGTLWPDSRLKWFHEDEGDSLSFTIEARHQGSSTISDNVSGLAFWSGLMTYYMSAYSKDEIINAFGEFSQVERNSKEVACHGLNAVIHWFGKQVKVQKLILDELLPFAEQGLLQRGVSSEEISRVLNPLELCVRKNRTQSAWIKNGVKRLKGKKRSDKQIDEVLVKEMVLRRSEPTSCWEPI